MMAGRLCRTLIRFDSKEFKRSVTIGPRKVQFQEFDNFLSQSLVADSAPPRRFKSSGNKSKDKEFSSLIQPLVVKPTVSSDDINIGAELSGQLKKEDLLRTLNEFYRRPVVKTLAAENGLDSMYHLNCQVCS